MIEFKDVSKVYDDSQVALDHLNLTINDNEFVCFIGTSGSGKTTCMRMINRMIEPSSGDILIDGKNIKDIDPVKLRRQIGYVIQSVGLLPHLTIFDNIVTVPRLLKWDDEKLRPLAEKLIKKVALPVEYLDRYPSELSGGQQQRIGVIRALAANQKIILMDEPYGALDPITRNDLQELIKKLQVEMGKTIVFVTHDMDEALKLADRIAILDSGELIQYDTPENILKNPANDYVRELIGPEKLNLAKNEYKTVESIMDENPVFIQEDANTKDALILMRKERVDNLYIVDEDKHLLGKIDIFDLMRTGRSNEEVKNFYHSAVSTPSSTKIREALEQFYDRDFRNLPVVNENNQLVGIVTRAKLVDAVYENIWGGEDTLSELQEESKEIQKENHEKALTEEAENA